MEKHYAHRDVTGNAYGLFDEGVLQGVCIFSSVIPNVAASFCGDEHKKKVTELSRLIVNDGLPPNSLSYFVSKSLKQLSKPRIIIAYSDMNQGHHGYIYQSLNFLYTGMGGDSKEFIIKGKQLSTRPSSLRRQMKLQGVYDENLTVEENVKKIGGEVIKLKAQKHRYVYFLGSKKQRKEMKECLRFAVLPYPKGENRRYDTNKKVNVQTIF